MLRLSLFAVFFLLNISLANASADEAEGFVKGLSDEVISIIKSDQEHDAKLGKLQNIFSHNVDIPWIARFVLGRYWRDLQGQDKDKYVDIYKKYLLKVYVPKFEKYNNEQFLFKKVLQPEDDEYIVQTDIVFEDSSPNVALDYKVRRKDGRFIIYDVVVEGVSLITTQRSEFASILSRQGVGFLVGKLEEKI